MSIHTELLKSEAFFTETSCQKSIFIAMRLSNTESQYGTLLDFTADFKYAYTMYFFFQLSALLRGNMSNLSSYILKKSIVAADCRRSSLKPNYYCQNYSLFLLKLLNVHHMDKL